MSMRKTLYNASIGTRKLKLQSDARKRIEKAVELLTEALDRLGDGDELERALAGVTMGMVETPGHAKQGTFLMFDARERLRDALKTK